jgi:hypothetical protein
MALTMDRLANEEEILANKKSYSGLSCEPIKVQEEHNHSNHHVTRCECGRKIEYNILIYPKI